MRVPRERLVETAAVFLGSVILFGGGSYFVFVWSADIVASTVGAPDVLDGRVGSAVIVLAGLAGLQIATEVTAIRLHGFDALQRGSRPLRLGRHLLLGLAVLAAAGLIVGSLAQVVRDSVAGDAYGTLLFAALVAIAVAWAAGRAITAFLAGFAGE